MREFRFRAWDRKENKMLNWSDLFNIPVFRLFPNNRYKIMQYTGLKDKNGNDIFEGDILRDCRDELGEVFFDDATFKLATFNETDELWEVADSGETIGNIYESPELLECKF